MTLADPATPAALAALHRRAFIVPRPWTEAEFADLLASATVLLLTEPGGFLLGSVVLDEAEILTLAVDPAHRRHGAGRRLLARFHAQASERGARRAVLEVAADNTAARALYRGAGYREIGRRPRYYPTAEGPRIDALVLEQSHL